MSTPFWQYWYFHLPNYLLVALTYTLLGRFLLALIAPPDWDNSIWRSFHRLIWPAVRLAGVITPRFVSPALLPLVAVYWLFVLRYLWLQLLAAYGLAPSLLAP